MSKIVNNKIIYATHTVVLDRDVYDFNYMIDMHFSLTEDGSLEDHTEELKQMNNDGSWSIIVNSK